MFTEQTFSTMKGKFNYSSWCALGLMFLCWLFIGLDEVFEENSMSREFFIKKFSTMQINFSNPYESNSIGEEGSYSKRRDEHGDWLPNTKELSDYLQYCKYRYGIIDKNQLQARTKCRRFEAASFEASKPALNR